MKKIYKLACMLCLMIICINCASIHSSAADKATLADEKKLMSLTTKDTLLQHWQNLPVANKKSTSWTPKKLVAELKKNGKTQRKDKLSKGFMEYHGTYDGESYWFQTLKKKDEENFMVSYINSSQISYIYESHSIKNEQYTSTYDLLRLSNPLYLDMKFDKLADKGNMSSEFMKYFKKVTGYDFAYFLENMPTICKKNKQFNNEKVFYKEYKNMILTAIYYDKVSNSRANDCKSYTIQFGGFPENKKLTTNHLQIEVLPTGEIDSIQVRTMVQKFN